MGEKKGNAVGEKKGSDTSSEYLWTIVDVSDWSNVFQIQ